VVETLLVANRGEIARRVIRTARRMGVRTVAVCSEADVGALHVLEADVAVTLGPPPPPQSYLDVAALLAAARQTGADAVHPGYGFLSENAGFAAAVQDAGLTWVGPAPEVIERMGDKVRARALVAALGVPVAPGSPDPLSTADDAVDAARQVGYPVMVKAAAGGGGIGMSVAGDDDELRAAFETARSRAERFFGDPSILVERFVSGARHVEVQVLGLPAGRVVALGERDCSVQRRHQKVAEETPSPAVSSALRERMLAAAVRVAESVGYRGAGTVECLVDPAAGTFFFLEMNTRLQVEHPITEMVTGLDLVEQQLLVAGGRPPTFDPDDPTAGAPGGHALELRVYAEDPVRFLPGPGLVTRWVEPAGEGVRVDSGYRAGDTVTPYYDPLLAKLVVHGTDRATALERARAAVAGFVVEGPKVNLPFFTELLDDPEFVSGTYDTGLVGRMRERRPGGLAAQR
jgi:acetyl-CoA carboxylase biotin carboxylase subunit